MNTSCRLDVVFVFTSLHLHHSDIQGTRTGNPFILSGHSFFGAVQTREVFVLARLAASHVNQLLAAFLPSSFPHVTLIQTD
jgi:hypothetical protein